MGEAGQIPNLLVSRTFSKSHSLAGVRVGYLAGPVDLIGALHKIRDSYNLDAVAQRLARLSIQDRDYTDGVVSRILRTREQTVTRLQDLGFTVLPSDTNFLFAKVPGGEDAEALFDRLVGLNIFVRYFPGPVTGSYLRITIGTNEDMDRFMDGLRSVLKTDP